MREIRARRHPCLVARTGYTGEDGFEIFVPERAAPRPSGTLLLRARQARGPASRWAWAPAIPCVWRRVCPSTATISTIPPRRWRPAWAASCKLEKPHFRGQERPAAPEAGGLHAQAGGPDDGGSQRPPRPLCRALDGDGAAIGEVTSGSFSPTLGKGIALAYLPRRPRAVGTDAAGPDSRASRIPPPWSRHHSIAGHSRAKEDSAMNPDDLRYTRQP